MSLFGSLAQFPLGLSCPRLSPDSKRHCGRGGQPGRERWVPAMLAVVAARAAATALSSFRIHKSLRGGLKRQPGSRQMTLKGEFG